MRETSVLLPNGQRKHFFQTQGESKDEFRGRVLCRIEEAITGSRVTPTPAGTRWIVWEFDRPHQMRKFWTDSLGSLVESTGNPYADRTRVLIGSYTLDQAERELGLRERRQ